MAALSDERRLSATPLPLGRSRQTVSIGRVGAPHHRDVRGEAKSESPPMKHVPRCRCVCHRSSESRHVVLRIYCHSRSIEGLTGVLCYDNFEDNPEKWRRRSRMNAGLPVTNILCRNKSRCRTVSGLWCTPGPPGIEGHRLGRRHQ